eukprot:scaffold99805_cov30-Phaeocystis_antarctica.AAC.1
MSAVAQPSTLAPDKGVPLAPEDGHGTVCPRPPLPRWSSLLTLTLALALTLTLALTLILTLTLTLTLTLPRPLTKVEQPRTPRGTPGVTEGGT